MATHGKLSAISVALVILALAALSIGDPSSGSASHGGLQNAGFEQGLTNWIPQAADAAVVVGTETSVECPTYTNMGGVTVQPHRGIKDLRLGTCRQINQSQPKGVNKVSQAFTVADSQLKFAFRLYSWEHRGYDQFSFELKKGNQAVGTLASAVTVPMKGAAGGQVTCSGALPCKFNIDAGKSGDFVSTGPLATDWIVATINIPQTLIGQNLTLTYSVVGGKDNGFASWAYFDNFNTPPVAKFEIESAGELFESEVVQFVDTSFDPDQPQDSIVSWLWEINGETINDQNPIFIFADEGTYSACLTVTDSLGDTNRVCAGDTATDGTPISALTLENAAPMVNAIDTETLAGQPVELFARVLEPGWEDEIGAEWQIGGQSPDAVVTVDNLAYLSTGIVTGELPALNPNPTARSGTLTVHDIDPVTGLPDGGEREDDFEVTIVENDSGRHEPENNSISDPPELVSDKAHLSWIQSVGDQDFFEVLLPDDLCPSSVDDCLLPAGGQLLVTLKGPGGAGLNADYDLVILAQTEGGEGFQGGESGQTSNDTSGFQHGGFQHGGFQHGSYRDFGFQHGGFQHGAVRPGGFQHGGFQHGGFQHGGFQHGSALYPLSEVGFNGLSGEDVGSADITLDELGLGTVEGNVTVAAYSANLGTGEEVALAQSTANNTRFFVGVVGANGAFSASQPYTLQIETSIPIDPAEVLGPEVCTAAPLVGSDPANPPTTEVDDLNGDDPGTPEIDESFPPAGETKTLIITQRERLIALADDPATTGVNEGLAAWATLEPKLLALAQHPAVMADVLSLPSILAPTSENPGGLYNFWDSNPCDVDNANAVAAAIRGEIQSRLSAEPTIEYVVLAGDDDIIPQRRVPDETIVGNEAFYALDSLLKPGSPLFSSLLFGFILTDDHLVDDVPTPWQGRELYVPDRPIGRLVETPEEIGAAADAFLTAGPEGGLLDYSSLENATALVTGYDFFTDGANVTAANLATSLDTSTLISPPDSPDPWTADELRCGLLGQTSESLTECPVSSVTAANAHWLHYAILSANGFAIDDFSDIINSNETATAGGPTPALDRKVVFTMGCHGGFNVPDRASLPPDPGLGIDTSLDFVQAMARQNAVFIASTGYGLGDDAGLGGTELLLTIFADNIAGADGPIGDTLRDAKESYLLSLLSMTTYDEKSSIQLTMFGLPMYEVDVPDPSPTITSAQAEEQSSGDTFTLTVQDGDTTTETTYSIETVMPSPPPSNESYLTADGDVQATAFRAIQPRVVITLPPENPAQGVLIKGGAFIDTPAWDPVISLPSQDWLLSDAEPQICLEAFWPAVPVTLNSLDPGGGGAQTLVVTPGQFRCTSGSAPTVTGIQRRYTELTVEILHSDPTDTEPPDVDEITLADGGSGSVNVTVEASDPSGIASIVLLKYSGGVITPTEFNLTEPFPPSGPFTINVPNVLADDDIAGEIVDGSDNVAYFTAKGSIGFTFLSVDLSPDPTYVTPGVEAMFQIAVPDFGQLDEPFYTIDFGDGQFGSGPVTGAIFTVPHTYQPGTELPTTATIRVMDATGRLGSDSVTVRELCDPIGDSPNASFDLVSCDVTTTETTMTIAVRVLGQVLNEGQYRVNIQTASKNAQLKVDNGHATGPLSSLVVTLGDPGELRFTFSLEEVGLTSSGAQLLWSADAQTVGFADTMPDSGVFTFVLP